MAAGALAGEPQPGAPFRAESLEALVSEMAALPGLVAGFDEERRVALLREPLHSRGEIVYAAPDRLVRRVLEPIPSSLRIDGERMVFRDGTTGEERELGGHPAVRTFGESFVRIFSGDLPGLRELYEIDFEPEPPDGEPWALHLRPRDPLLRRAIEALVLRGRGARLLDLRVDERNGDGSLTRFRDFQVGRPGPARLAAPAPTDAP